MALNLTTALANYTPANGDYPYGSAKDATGGSDGSEYKAVRANDVFGFQQALLKAAGILPSGNADKVGGSQYLQSVNTMAGGAASFYADSGAANAYVLSLPSDVEGAPAVFDGQDLFFIASADNTGACTVNPLGYGAISIKKDDGSTDPDAGQISSTKINWLKYDANLSVFRIFSIFEQGAATDTSPARYQVTKSGHGFTVGKALKFSGPTVNDFSLAQADSLSNAAHVWVVVEVIDTDNYVIQQNGHVTGLTGGVAGSVGYVSESSAGVITTTAPTLIEKAVIFWFSATEGFLFNHPIKDLNTTSTSILQVQDRRASGTAGSIPTGGGVWDTRVLNTVVTNNISGASVSSNHVTLPAGTYRIEAYGFCSQIEYSKGRLRNTTDNSTTINGTSTQSNASTSGAREDGTFVFLKGEFAIASTKNFEFQQYVTTTSAARTFGQPVTSGDPEVYLDMVIEKV